MQEIETKQKINQEYQEMFETLQAAVIVVKNQSINFMNKSFKKLARKL